MLCNSIKGFLKEAKRKHRRSKEKKKKERSQEWKKNRSRIMRWKRGKCSKRSCNNKKLLRSRNH